MTLHEIRIRCLLDFFSHQSTSGKSASLKSEHDAGTRTSGALVVTLWLTSKELVDLQEDPSLGGPTFGH